MSSENIKTNFYGDVMYTPEQSQLLGPDLLKHMIKNDILSVTELPTIISRLREPFASRVKDLARQETVFQANKTTPTQE